MIETIKNLSNIAFFVIVSFVTILSYLHARKTLFAPIRTETFKLQLNAFQELLLYFQNKPESDFLEAMDLNRIVALNAMQMADDYVFNFFPNEITIDKEEREKQLEPLIGAIISKEHLLKGFEKTDGDTPIVRLQSDEKTITNPALILANWQKYEHGIIDYTKEYSDQVKELDRFAASAETITRTHWGVPHNPNQQSLAGWGDYYQMRQTNDRTFSKRL